MFWFDTPLYHTLYQHRNDLEAKNFIENLLSLYVPAPATRLVDVACGKGRHVRILGETCPQSNILGLDLAAHSIAYAQTHHGLENCQFAVHDMRQSLVEKFGQFDFIFNLFTSFGYFPDKATHQAIIDHWSAALLEKGILLIDYMNVIKVSKELVAEDIKEIDGYTFLSQRKIENGFIIKDIYPKGKDLAEDLHFQERVATFTLADFEAFLSKAGLKILQTFGNYQLEAFDPEHSPRLIIIAQKN